VPVELADAKPAPLPSASSPAFHKQFGETTDACLQLCPPGESPKDPRWVLKKLAALGQVTAWLSAPGNSPAALSDTDQTRLCDVIKTNLFRDYTRMDPALLLFDVFAPCLHDKAWAHLEIVYLILYKLHNTCPSHSLFNSDFLQKMFQLFSTPDPDERQELVQFFKTFLPKHPAFRDAIFSHLCCLIQRHVEGQENPFEVATALPILLAMCELAEPDARSLDAIESLVVPLLRDRYLDFFNLHVVNLLEHFVTERPEKYGLIVGEILKYWPRTKISKMCILTVILVDYLPKVSEQELLVFLPPFLRLIAENCNSSSPRLAEVSYSLFLTVEFDSLMVDHTEMMLSVLVPAVARSMLGHWEASIRERGVLCLAIMEKFDAAIFKKFSQNLGPRACPTQNAAWAEMVKGYSDESAQEAQLAEIARLFPMEGDQ
jgi:hypothetical protein